MPSAPAPAPMKISAKVPMNSASSDVESLWYMNPLLWKAKESSCGMIALRLHGADEAGDQRAGRHADGLHAELVDQSRDDDALAGAEALVAGARDGRGVHHLQRTGEEPGALHLGPRLKAGGGGTRAERGDGDAAAAQLLGERFRERENVRLGGVVDGHQRPGLKGRRRGDVEDAAPAAGEHPGKEPLRQVSGGFDVEPDLLDLLREVRLGERPEG